MHSNDTSTSHLAATMRALREHYMSRTTTPSQHVAEVKHAQSVAEQAAEAAMAVNKANAEVLSQARAHGGVLLGNSPLAEQDAIAALGLTLLDPKAESPHWSSAYVAGVVEMHAARLGMTKITGMAYDLRVAAAKVRELQEIINAGPSPLSEQTRQKFLADGVEP